MSKDLEAIDNAEPSEALEAVKQIEFYVGTIIGLKFVKGDNVFSEAKKQDYEIFERKCNIIKQALLKAQKEHNSINLLMQELDCKDFADLRKYARCGYEKLNNKYLKWEDLKFNHTPKMTDVKMNGNKYKLVVGYNVAGKNLAILRDGKKEYYFLECDKQFFNDLHLERVEE